ncbi:hypothetical protein AN958_11615 [Leucoagaricus sp. SymC.cos]|nr:hypothetical protein AN958_11615 [Leucoagaricus sp. SymC.cos]
MSYKCASYLTVLTTIYQYSHILLHKTTAAFFVFSFILCLAQGVIQSLLFSIDSEYKTLLHRTIETVDNAAFLNITEIPSQLNIETIPLRLCNSIPIGERPRRENCTIIFNTSNPDPTTEDQAIVALTTLQKMDQISFNAGTVPGTVTVRDASLKTRTVTPRCAQTLLYAHQNIRNFSSEDLTFILLQFWLLGISMLAVTNDSVAHLWTVLMTRALITAWSTYSLWRTQNFTSIFQRLYSNPGTPCNINFFPDYFKIRLGYEIPDLVLNVIGFGITCWLSFHLLRIYNAQAVHYVGAPEHINRINKLFLAVLSCLQLEVFILVTAMGLWVDVLSNTAIRHISKHTAAYLGVFITTSIVSLIVATQQGWYSIKREMKRTVLVFFFLAFVIILGWSVMFYSLVYRWTFLQWPFLAGCSVSSFILIVCSTALAIACRLNFGRGLKQYLHAEAALAKSGFAPEVFRHDEEKNTPFDLSTADLKESSFSPTSPTAKYQQPIPTYLIQPLPHNRPASIESTATVGRQAGAQGAPLRVPKQAERPTGSSMQPLSKYGVKFGESF